MSKVDIDDEQIGLFTDEEIIAVCKNADLSGFINLIKNKRYEKYTKRLGSRIDKKSLLVQKLLPNIVFSLYKKGEEPFIKAIKGQLQKCQDTFEYLVMHLDHPVKIDDITEYSVKDIVNLYFDIQRTSDKDISLDLFFVFLKLYGIEYDECSRLDITKEIEIFHQKIADEENYKKDRENALKKQEKRLTALFEGEKVELLQKIEDAKEQYRRVSNELELAKKQIEQYEHITSEEKRAQEEQWQKLYQIKLEEQRVIDEQMREARIADAQKKYEELERSLECDMAQKIKELESEYQRKQMSLEEQVKTVLSRLQSEVSHTQEQKRDLVSQVRTLEQNRSSLQEHIQELESAEERYFETLDQRIIEKKIDATLVKKLGLEAGFHNEKGSKIVKDNSDVFVVSAQWLPKENDYGAAVEAIEDFVEDYKDNLAIYFDSETDIAGIVMAGICSKMAIIATDKVCEKIALSLSALLDLSTPTVIIPDTTRCGLNSVMAQIDNCDSQVICIKGVLDNYDENLFVTLCDTCKSKYLFFSVTDLEKLKMLSSSIYSYAIVVDAEEKLHFPVEETLLIGDSDITPFIPDLRKKQCQDVYKKVFNRLVAKHFMNKSKAFIYSELVQRYYDITENTVMGEVLQRSVVIACDFRDAEDGVEDILLKSGINIMMD